MPLIQPGKGDVHVNRPLTQIAVAFSQRPDMFIADRAFPIVPVAKQSDSYFVIPRGAWFRDEMKKRAPGTESAGRTHQVSNDTYNADVWALHEDLADQIRANYDSPLQAEREMTEGLTLAGMIRKERLFSTSFMATSVWTGDFTGVAASPSTSEFLQWNDPLSTPIEDIRAGATRLHARSGFRPNKLILGRQVYDKLIDHPDIVGRIDRGQTAGTALVLRQTLAALFEVGEVLIMDSVYNSAVEGATDAYAFIGGKSALLIYAPASPGLYVPSAGYTFSWSALGGTGMRVKRFRMEPTASDRIEIEMAFAHKKVSADLGSFFATAVA